MGVKRDTMTLASARKQARTVPRIDEVAIAADDRVDVLAACEGDEVVVLGLVSPRAARPGRRRPSRAAGCARGTHARSARRRTRRTAGAAAPGRARRSRSGLATTLMR